ncbi:hypothetical protein FHX08_006336 [Rhizobium sp. BK529]|uniref:hypothetical protein n=1 Tax=Rhizobium sp. BK529 TaxID=2586983 RepID=UPI00161136C6|nr:hypothetical protein [Rhizobium sp. BK529]MBB3595916.1 hypothetical protein [Rhizobium sp. BK529]
MIDAGDVKVHRWMQPELTASLCVFPAKPATVHRRSMIESKDDKCGEGFLKWPAYRTCLLATVALLASCSSEADQQRRILQQMGSWIASAEMITEARLDGRVPATFSGPALERCSREVSALVDELKNSGFSPSQTAFADLPSLLGQATDAASRRDRPQTERVVSALRRTRDDLDRLRKIR